MLKEIFEIVQFCFLFSLLFCVFGYGATFAATLPDLFLDWRLDWYEAAMNDNNKSIKLISFIYKFKNLILFLIFLIYGTIWLFIIAVIVMQIIKLGS